MDDDQTQQVLENIRREAAQFAEASVYSLSNPYLEAHEKTEVELWFLLPIRLALVAFLGCAIYSVYEPLPWYLLLGIPVVVDLFCGTLLWAFYRRKFVLAFYMTLVHNWVLWALTLIAAVWIAVTGHYGLALSAILLKAILSVLFGWHIFLYSLLAHKYRMHPKYAFFKRFYGRKFPFEPEA